jgi:hypothetical protein
MGQVNWSKIILISFKVNSKKIKKYNLEKWKRLKGFLMDNLWMDYPTIMELLNGKTKIWNIKEILMKVELKVKVFWLKKMANNIQEYGRMDL